MPNFRKIVIIVLLLLFAISFYMSATNLLLLSTNRGYYIPNESSIFTFRADQMNDGSGEWWITGHDWQNYYHANPEGSGYYYINKHHDCRQFDENNFYSWCLEAILVKNP